MGKDRASSEDLSKAADTARADGEATAEKAEALDTASDAAKVAEDAAADAEKK